MSTDTRFFMCDGYKIPYMVCDTEKGKGVLVPAFGVPKEYWDDYQTAWLVTRVTLHTLNNFDTLLAAMQAWEKDGLCFAEDWGGSCEPGMAHPQKYGHSLSYGVAVIPAKYIKPEDETNELGLVAL